MMRGLGLLVIFISLLAQARTWAQTPDPFERQSIGPLLKQIGYNPPAGRRHEWPFKEFTANTQLNRIAVTINGELFPGIRNPRSTIWIFNVPEGSPATLTRAQANLEGSVISDPSFLSENLLRFRSENDYVFLDVESGRKFGFIDFTGRKDIRSINPLSADLYLVGVSGKDPSLKNTAEIIRFNPFDRRMDVLGQITDPRRARALIVGTNTQSREANVWNFGAAGLLVRFSLPDPLTRELDPMALEIKGNKTVIGPAPLFNFYPGVERLRNSATLFQSATETGIVVQDFARTARLELDLRVNHVRNMRAVSSGFIGEEFEAPNTRHYFYGLNGEKPRLLHRGGLVQRSDVDGGFMALTEPDPKTGKIDLIRVLYDQDALAESGLENASDCALMLLGAVWR